MHFRYKSLALSLAIATALFVSAFAAKEARAAVGEPSEPNTVTCMYPVWVGFGPVHLANELGYFAEEGLTVEEILDDDMPNGIAAMERGDIDCYLRTVGEYQGLGRRKETQGTIIGTIDLSTGGDGWAADQSIASVCDLQGKTIAVEPNLPARLLLQMALKEQCNLSIADTNLSDIAAADAIGVFADPSVAAVGTYEPVLSQVVSTHTDRGAHILLSSKDYDDLILDVIMAHTDDLRANPDKYRRFLRAVYRAVDYFYANQEEAIPIIAEHFSISPDDFTATLPNFRYTPFEEAIQLIGSADTEGRAYEVFREAMALNLEFGSSDVELFPEDHIDRSVINQLTKDW
jgi:NitT/TauT family transport system substrate-binding protein